MARTDPFQERLIRELSELKTQVLLGNQKTELGNQKIDTLDLRINGRIKKLEKVVFGDEEAGMIGLAEGARVESREIKALNKKWAIVIAAIVFFAQNAATWTARKLGWNEPSSLFEATEAAGITHRVNTERN